MSCSLLVAPAHRPAPRSLLGSILAAGLLLAPHAAWPQKLRLLLPEKSEEVANFYSRFTLSPDGQWAATYAPEDGSFRVWDAQAGLRLLTLERYTGQNTDGGSGHMVFSADSRQLLATTPEYLRVLNLATGLLSRKLAAPAGETFQAAYFCPDGTGLLAISRHPVFPPDSVRSKGYGSFASIGEVDSARLWDLNTGLLRMRPAPCRATALSPDGRQLAFVQGHDTISLRDAQSGAKQRVLYSAGSKLSSLCFSPNSRHLLAVSQTGLALMWDAQTGALLHRWELGDQQFNRRAAAFSPDSRRLALTQADGSARVFDVSTGKLMRVFRTGLDSVKLRDVFFNADGQHLAAVSDYEVYQWDTASEKRLRLTAEKLSPSASDKAVREAFYSPNGKHLLTVTQEGVVKGWNVRTGAQRFGLRDPSPDLTEGNLAGFKSGDDTYPELVSGLFPSANGARLLTNQGSGLLRVWDATNGLLLTTLNKPPKAEGNWLWKVKVSENNISPNGQHLALVYDAGARFWNASTGTMHTVPAAKYTLQELSYSPSGQQLAAVYPDKIVFLHPQTGAPLSAAKLPGQPPGKRRINSLLTPDKRYLLRQFGDTVRVWNVEEECEQFAFQYSRNDRKGGSPPALSELSFSAEGHRMSFVGFRRTSTSTSRAAGVYMTEVWSLENGLLLGRFSTGNRSYRLSPDGRHLFALAHDGNYRYDTLQWRTATAAPSPKPSRERGGDNLYAGQVLLPFNYPYPDQPAPAPEYYFSPDGTRLLTHEPATDSTRMLRIWDAATGNVAARLQGQPHHLLWAKFSKDNRKVLTLSGYYKGTRVEHPWQLWDAKTGRLLWQLDSLSAWGSGLEKFGPENVSADLTHVFYAFQASGIRVQPLDSVAAPYSLVWLDEENYLVYDQHYRYDGTEAARKRLYFTCGTEVIGLDQLKDQLWVPGLAQRLARGEAIGAPTIEQLDLCGRTPEVEPLHPPTDEKRPPRDYRFRIRPRRGGLGAVVLAVNGIEVRRYQPRQLRAVGAGYELRVPAAELARYFVAGQANPVTVKAYTAENAIASRGAQLVQPPTAPATPPNLYAVVVGVSDYKGEALDLRYAAKDAHALGQALGASARRLLNHDGREHVFIHELSTGPERERLPEKLAIGAALEQIGRQATANDIVLVFFAGHGVTAGPDKRFYFLTADASPAAATDAGAVARVGISTQELGQWLHPSQLRAQKRVLIFDACQSGQAINDFVKLGGGADPQNLAARNDDAGQRIKAVEKLNEQSGLFILSASSSTQSAYELGRYAQGLLTYALLRALKEQPDILEDGRYLSVGRWFAAAEGGVQALALASGQRQQPQLVSTTNFTLGEVDQSVRASIHLETEKPLFAASNFQNADPSLLDDDLGLSALLDGQFQEISARGGEAPLVFAGNGGGMAEAYSLLGRYTVQGAAVQVRVSIRQNRRVLAQFEATGRADDLEQLAAAIARQASERVRTLK